MRLDILQDSWIYESDSDSVIQYTDLVNTTLASGITKFKLNFDFNVNISDVQVSIVTTSGVTASGTYGEISDLENPAVHYPSSSYVDTFGNFLNLDFTNFGTTSTSGVVSSGILCGGSSYLQSEPYFMFDCNYTTLLYVKQLSNITGVIQDNLFFRAEGPYSEILSLGVTSNHTLSLLLFDGTSEVLYDTGLPFLSNQWNLISLRCSPKTKLRIGCGDSFVEINKSCAFLGGSSVIYLGGSPGIGYFGGILSDLTWWPSYADNIFIEYAITHPIITLNGQKRPISTTITSSGVTFDLDENYPSRVYLEFDFPTTNVITGISVNTYDSDYTLTTSGGSDTLFCGTVVRGYTSTDYPISLYNHTDYETYGYIFPYDSNRYKALSVSSDGENYLSNQVSLPQDVSWTSGEFRSGINNEIVIGVPYNTKINSDKKIILHDNSRKCLWYLSKDDFGFYDLRTKYFYDRAYPAFVSSYVYNIKNNWVLDVDGNYIYFICYESGVYRYSIVSNTWTLLSVIPTCDNVCISISSDYIFFSYYYNSVSEVFRYNLISAAVESVCSFNISSIKIESNRDSLFVLAGNVIFKYDVDTLNVITVSQQIGLTNVSEIKDICGYISIVTISAVYSLSYSQDGWGALLKVYDFSSSFSISCVSNCSQYISFVKSNEVRLARLSHYRYMDTNINILNNYNNTLSLLPLSTTDRYEIVWGWLDVVEEVPNFYLASKFSMSETIIYGFSRDTSPSAGTMSIFMSFNFITKKYVTLAAVIPNNLLDVENGCLVETYNEVYYINFNKGHYYRYDIATNTWGTISAPKTYGSISNCTVVSAVWDLDKKIYAAGESLGGYVDQNYDDNIDRYYSFFGYIDIDTNIFHNMYYLPYVTVDGLKNNSDPLEQGGTSFTCDLTYSTNNNNLFLVISQYTSKSMCYMYNMDISFPSTGYIFNSLEDLYDYGCIIYNPFTVARLNNLMNNYYFYILGNVDSSSSDIPGRNAINLTGYSSSNTVKWLGGSVGLKTSYEFSVNTRIKVPVSSSYMPIMLDNAGKEGFEVGFYNNDIITCCRKGGTYLEISYPMASAGIAKGDWVDLGASLSCVSGTYINLYINGNNIMSSGIVTTCSGYSSSAEFKILETLGSPYMDSTSQYYYYSDSNAKITELTVFNRNLSNQEFSDISYTNSGKSVARILMDYNKINDIRLPQSYYEVGTPPSFYYDGVDRLYSIYDYTSNYIYYLSNYTFIRVNIFTLDSSWANLRSSYNSACDYTIANQTVKNCFIETSTDTVVGQLTYGPLYIGAVFDDSTRYFDTGSFVSPVISVGDTGVVAYNFEYSLVRDAYLDFYIRYANDKPVDFCHIYYVDSSNNFIESSLATGKVFYTVSVGLQNSCDVYYDDTVIKITKDGNVYKSTDYVTPTDIFELAGYTLANVSSTYFSYNGSYILYYTSDKYLVGFPLSLGIPCMRTSVTYSSVDYVAWSKYAQQLSVTAGDGVYVYNFVLGEIDYVENAYRIFYIYEGPVIIKSTDSSVMLNKEGIYYSYVVDDIDFSKNIEFDYTTEWIYYVTLDGNLKRMRFISSETGAELEFLSLGIMNVNDIYKVTFDYILLIVDAKIATYTKSGFIAVSDYPLPYMNSGNVVFFDYNPSNKTTYYNLDYLSNNDLIWSDLLDWVPLGSKSSGFVVGKKYIQLKAVFKTSSNKNATPILSRAHFSFPVRVGPILPHTSNDFYVKLDMPLDDQGDIYSVKLITLAEDVVR